jgi:hypothetical protein
VTIDGNSDEIKALLEYYAGSAQRTSAAQKTAVTKSAPATKSSSAEHSITEIVNQVKNSKEAESIELHILNKQSQVDRTLLPLYIVHEYLDNAMGLTSGDISRITSELGIPISTANASGTLSGTASRYVVGNRLRKQGQPVHYKLSLRGVTYLKSVISGQQDDKAS